MPSRGSRRNSPIKRPDEIEALKVSADIVSGVHGALKEKIVPGVSTTYLDNLAEEYIRDHQASPAFKGYVMGGDVSPFPATLCISINDVVVHGIPSLETLHEGDIVTVDVGTVKEGYYGDCACTYAVGEINDEKRRLLEATLESLNHGVEQAIAGNWVYDIAREVQKHVESQGFSVVRELVGHGIGRSLHEEPALPNFIPNPFSRHRYRNQRLEEGMVLCIEPMVNAGGYRVVTEEDGWTVRTEDRKPSAHFEHMVVVRNGRAEILTTHLPHPESMSLEF